MPRRVPVNEPARKPRDRIPRGRDTLAVVQVRVEGGQMTLVVKRVATGQKGMYAQSPLRDGDREPGATVRNGSDGTKPRSVRLQRETQPGRG